MRKKTKISSYEKNTIGNDYVVGDIHGCYDEFFHILKYIGFDFSKDRIFSVGDMFDRGTNDLKSLLLLPTSYPWFIPILGNHEAMAMHKFFRFSSNNGNGWLEDILDDETHIFHYEVLEVLEDLKYLPHALEIFSKEGKKIGITHAELPYTCYSEEYTEHDGTLVEDLEASWDRLKEWEICTSPTWMDPVIWGRDSLNHDRRVPDIDLVIHGHTILNKPLFRGNRLYLDTGFFNGVGGSIPTGLSFYSIDSNSVFTVFYDFKNKKAVDIESYSLEELTLDGYLKNSK